MGKIKVFIAKPFVFFILGPIFAAIVFGNIIYSIQKVIEKGKIGETYNIAGKNEINNNLIINKNYSENNNYYISSSFF